MSKPAAGLGMEARNKAHVDLLAPAAGTCTQHPSREEGCGTAATGWCGLVQLAVEKDRDVGG